MCLLSCAGGRPCERGWLDVAVPAASFGGSAAVHRPPICMRWWWPCCQTQARSEGILRSTLGFLRGQYLITGGDGRTTLSRTVARDVFMRCAYIAPQLT
jgi:hypothetical protein